jgi:uncharacterized protein (DUF1501 family)
MNHTKLNNSFPTLDRRSFMKMTGGCAALSSTSLLSTLINLKLTNVAAAASDTSGYKAIVCVFLMGGIDSHNVLAPYPVQGSTEYTDYVAARSNLALTQAQMLPIVSEGRTFGLHAGMPELKTLYDQGDLAFVANVGSLVEPLTKANYNSKRKPLGLYSHSDLVMHWQTSIPQSRSQLIGWGGRMADMLTSAANQHPTISMNIALGSLNLLQTGDTVIPYVVQTGGATSLSGFPNTGTGIDGMYSRFTSDALGQSYGNLLEKSYAGIRMGSIQAAIDFNAATAAVNLGNVVFPNTSLSNQLRMVARTIGARSTLRSSRQIFFVSAGGWDMHADLLSNQNSLLPQVSQAMKAFYDSMSALGVQNDVVTFTCSDFARTLTSNGTGSDHGWGGNHIVMGGPVRGGKVYGDYPTTLAPNNSLDMGRGRLIPTVAVDQYNAELARWFGIANDSTLVDILPNIRNFYSSSATAGPLGFLV